MNIGEVSKRANLPAKTIRYYEDVGLISPERRENGYREFGEVELNKLVFIGHARALGFGMSECRDLLALYEDDARESAEVKKIARNHLVQIEEKIADLQRMHGTLSDLISACAGDERPNCPILNQLSAS